MAQARCVAFTNAEVVQHRAWRVVPSWSRGRSADGVRSFRHGLDQPIALRPASTSWRPPRVGRQGLVCIHHRRPRRTGTSRTGSSHGAKGLSTTGRTVSGRIRSSSCSRSYASAAWTSCFRRRSTRVATRMSSRCASASAASSRSTKVTERCPTRREPIRAWAVCACGTRRTRLQAKSSAYPNRRTHHAPVRVCSLAEIQPPRP
jgi:hypothetical protein